MVKSTEIPDYSTISPPAVGLDRSVVVSVSVVRSPLVSLTLLRAVLAGSSDRAVVTLKGGCNNKILLG